MTIALSLIGCLWQYWFLDDLLFSAPKAGGLERVGLLLDDGANINAKGELRDGTPLVGAIRGNHADVTEFLVRRGADVNESSEVSEFDDRQVTPPQAADGHPVLVAILNRAGGTI